MFFINIFHAFIGKALVAHFCGEAANDLGIGQGLSGGICYFLKVADPSFRIGHGSFFFGPGCRRQYHIGIGQCFSFVCNFLHHNKFCFA
ncbi:hypothetical protein D3C86_1822960 [compost metagenome]